MNGVEILSKNVMYEYEPSIVVCLITFGIVMVWLTTLSILTWRDEKAGKSELIGLIFLSFVFAVIVGTLTGYVCGYYTDEVEYVEYKVTIDDSVSMDEFYEHYEVLGQEGKIYTVRPKNDETLTN